mgnify:CR=1 FL=1
MEYFKNILRLFDKKQYSNNSLHECLESELIYRTLIKNKEENEQRRTTKRDISI